MIAAIYARKSTKQEGTAEAEKSVATQVAQAQAFIARHGWAAGPVFADDGISGALFGTQRPGFAALMEAVAHGPSFGALVMSETARLGRESVDTAKALKTITERGVEVWTYLDGTRHAMDSAMDKVMFSLKGFTDETEREQASTRTHSKLAEKFVRGHHVGGRVFGYKNIDVAGGTDKHGRPRRSHVVLEVLPAEAAIVRAIFARYAEGDGITRIAKGLNEEGVAPPRAGTGSWAPSAVREILRRPLYVGHVIWNKSQGITRGGATAQRRRPEAEWLTREAPELRIVSAALWEAVEQRRLRAAASCPGLTRDGRRAGRPPGVDSRSATLLSGLAQCALCGASLVGFTRSHGTGAVRRRVRFYGCVYHKLRGGAVCTNSVVIRQERLDAVFLDALAEALDERLLARAVALALEREQARGREAPDRRAALRRERDAPAAAVRNLLEAVKHGRATETLLAELAVQEARGKALDRELAELDQRPRVVPLDRKGLEARLTALGRDMRGVLGAGGPEARRLLQRVLNGRRVACTPFREAGRRGYRFRATGNYAGVVSQEMRGPNGIRTRVSALRGPCPRPLDDGATSVRRGNWLGEEDLNLHYGVQSPASYH
jgi:site-specific DNA recombinase